jgi:TPP-dependent pyruvate/acetoin dehydrogenase alpha subunit
MAASKNNQNLSNVERITALIEEQSLTKEELITYLRQIMEIRALENNIASLLSKAVLKVHLIFMQGKKQ